MQTSREQTNMRARVYFYLDYATLKRLDALAATRGSARSVLVADVLRAHLDRDGGAAADESMRVRLDRMSALLARIERDQQIGLESVAHFVRYQLTVTPPLAEADLPAARALGQERFATFVDQVARRLAGGRGLAREVVDRLSPTDAEKPA